MKSAGLLSSLIGRSATRTLAGAANSSRPEGFSLRLVSAPVVSSRRAMWCSVSMAAVGETGWGTTGGLLESFKAPMLKDGRTGRHRTEPSGSASQSMPSRLLPFGRRSERGSVRFQLSGLKRPMPSPRGSNERPASPSRRTVVWPTQSKRSRTSHEVSLTKTMPPADPHRVLRSMQRSMSIQESYAGLTG